MELGIGGLGWACEDDVMRWMRVLGGGMLVLVQTGVWSNFYAHSSRLLLALGT